MALPSVSLTLPKPYGFTTARSGITLKLADNRESFDVDSVAKFKAKFEKRLNQIANNSHLTPREVTQQQGSLRHKVIDAIQAKKVALKSGLRSKLFPPNPDLFRALEQLKNTTFTTGDGSTLSFESMPSDRFSSKQTSRHSILVPDPSTTGPVQSRLLPTEDTRYHTSVKFKSELREAWNKIPEQGINVTSKEAIQFLTEQKVGDFIIRNSESKPGFLVFSCRIQDGIHHILFKLDPGETSVKEALRRLMHPEAVTKNEDQSTQPLKELLPRETLTLVQQLCE